MTTTPQHPFPMPGETFDGGIVVAPRTSIFNSAQVVVLTVLADHPYSYRVGIYDLAAPGPTPTVGEDVEDFIHFADAVDAFQPWGDR